MNRRISFSNLHKKALQEKRLSVDLSERLRKRIEKLLAAYDDSMQVQRDPHNSWITNTDVASEVVAQLERLYGTDLLNGDGITIDSSDATYSFLKDCEPVQVFDLIQLWYDEVAHDRRNGLQQELNLIFEEEESPWIFCDREFFQVDSRFLHERVVTRSHELLTTNGYQGALDEYMEARNDFESADYKGTILNSCKAFESVMKSILGKKSGQAGDLIKGLNKAGILDDLPGSLRNTFATKVLQSLPILRNEVAGHGQGEEVVTASRDLAELCLHLGGAFILYCVRRQLIVKPKKPIESSTMPSLTTDDSVPF